MGKRFAISSPVVDSRDIAILEGSWKEILVY